MKKKYIIPKVSNNFPIVHSMIMESQTLTISTQKEEDGDAEARQRGTYTEQANELNLW